MLKNPLEDLRRQFAGLYEPVDGVKAVPAPVDHGLLARDFAHELNPASWMYERLGKYIQAFESELDQEHEIGVRLVSFGQSITFHVKEVGYHGPDIITFYGQNEQGEKLQLIQHMSQLSFLLIAMRKLGEKPRRIGFLWDKEPEDEQA